MHVGTSDWSADFESDSGHLLLPGTVFHDATRFPFNTTSRPGLSITSPGRGCNEILGTFTVQQATYDAGGNVKTFAATFEQRCEGTAPALFGSIAYRAARPASVVTSGLKLATDRPWYVHGADATVTATLPGESGPVPVAIYAQPDGGTETLVATGTIAGGGSFSAASPLERQYPAPCRAHRPPHDVVAREDSDGASAGGAGDERQSGRRAAPPTSTPSTVTPPRFGMVMPNHAGACVRFRAEQYVDGAWAPALTSECVTLDQSSVATWRGARRPAHTGRPDPGAPGLARRHRELRVVERVAVPALHGLSSGRHLRPQEPDRAVHRERPLRDERVVLALVDPSRAVDAGLLQQPLGGARPADRAGLVAGAVVDQHRLGDPVEVGARRRGSR